MIVRWLGIDPSHLHDYWDCTLVADLLNGHVWAPPNFPTFEHVHGKGPCVGGVLVVAGGEYKDRLAEVNHCIRQGRPAAMVVVKDEGSVFPIDEVKGKVPVFWVQNARQDRHGPDVIPFPVGWTPSARAAIARAPLDKTLDVFFAGQVTHARRKQCMTQLKALPDTLASRYLETPGFLQGMPYPEYMANMIAAKVAPCPGGVITPDCFRVWEALEAGAIPIVDTHGGRGEVDAYWPNLLRRAIPFPVVRDWAEAPGHIERLLDGWPYHANRIEAWYGTYKRDLAIRFQESLRGFAEPVKRPGDRLTVLMPTSSIPSHPDTSIMEQTLKSVRDRLEHSEIIIMCDGLRDQHAARRPAYEEYIRRLHRLCKQYTNVMVLVFDRPMHQSGMTQEALRHVRTPAILYVEHDTPLVHDIPFEQLIDAVEDKADVVRLHHEVQVLDVHMHMMPDGRRVQDVCGVPLVRTFQWSQRPHVANTGFYRQILADHFDNSRDPMFIEDRMHGICEVAWRKHGEAGWLRYRLWMYHPDTGNIQRSIHLDGRAGEEKVG